MKVYKRTEIHRGLYAIECPNCGRILASSSEREMLPEYVICHCKEKSNGEEESR